MKSKATKSQPVVVELWRDYDCEMYSLVVNGVDIDGGNDWDGVGPEGFNVIVAAFKAAKIPVKSKEIKGRYTDAGEWT